MDRLPAWVEVDLDAVRWNLERIREVLPEGVKVLLVVKADAYGHGAVKIAQFAARCGVDMFGVATLDEGEELREAGITEPILIWSPILTTEISGAVKHNLAVSVSSYEFADQASKIARELGSRCSIHVEVDTGMGRAGVRVSQAVSEIERMSRLEGIKLEGVFTHFPASDLDEDFTLSQIREFSQIVERLEVDGISFKYVHAANSAAIINFSSSVFNMVRPGLVVYGNVPSLNLRDKLKLVPVMSFKTKLVLVKELEPGMSVSYGRTFIATRKTKVGVIPVGYGHGLSHRLSNKGKFLFRGKRVPIIGRVTMDMTMLDLTDFDDPSVGEEVVIFGKQGDGEITVDEIAGLEGTLNYEVLCRISKRVTRVYLKSGKVDSMKTLLGVREGK